jgi:hypothetical protein
MLLLSSENPTKYMPFQNTLSDADIIAKNMSEPGHLLYAYDTDKRSGSILWAIF